MKGSECEEDSENEKAMLWFMDIEENINEANELEVNDDNPLYDDILCAFKELYEIWKRY